jgi:Ca2+:H+ antiporter
LRTWFGIASSLAAAGLLGLLHHAEASAVVQFFLGVVALALLAWTIGVGTESVGARYGPAMTGVLQATLGNLPEFFIVIFALRAGEIVIAQTSILGSLLANALLILGLTIVAGAWRSDDGIMRFHTRLPQDTTTLLMLVVFMIAILSITLAVEAPAAQHDVAISSIGAAVILLVYGAWLLNYLRAGAEEAPAIGEHHVPPLGFAVGLAVLAVAGIAAAFASEWFVAVIDPAVEELGISKAFTGLVIVAIAGNAVEHVVGVQLAWKGHADLAISVVKNSVAQVAAVLYPALVLVSLLFTQRLTFGYPGVGLVLVVALVFAALAIWQITGDGEAAGYAGLALLATYAILATVVWFE